MKLLEAKMQQLREKLKVKEDPQTGSGEVKEETPQTGSGVVKDASQTSSGKFNDYSSISFCVLTRMLTIWVTWPGCSEGIDAWEGKVLGRILEFSVTCK